MCKMNMTYNICVHFTFRPNHGAPKKVNIKAFCGPAKKKENSVKAKYSGRRRELEEDSTALSRNVPIQKAAEENDMSFSIVLPFTCRMEFF